MDTGSKAFKSAKKTKVEDGPNYIDVHVGTRVRMRRKAVGMSQEDLAKAIELTFQQVQKYEKASNRISASKLYEIACVLKVKPEYFYDGLDGTGDDLGATTSERTATMFLATSEGITLAQAFPLVKQASVRKRILDLVRSLGEDD